MEDLIFLNISNTFIINALIHIMFNRKGIYKNMKDRGYEKFKIIPIYPNLKIVYNYLFIPLVPALRGLKENVSFMEIIANDPVFIMNCDWCSINNGIIHTAVENIKNDIEIIKRVDFKRMKMIDQYLDFILVDRKPSNKSVLVWCNNKFGYSDTNILLLSNIYLKLELLETRWCPFKRSKEFYYRNKDARFLEPSEQMLLEVGKILSQQDTITCNNCPKLINDKFKKTNSISAFQPLLDHMLRQII